MAERGATLSVGQKQLLSFARALAFDPPVLILDEATSSVDTETELLIRDALDVVMHGRTTIAIAHRLSTIQDMDRILVLHKGELRESGTHQELLARAASTTGFTSCSFERRQRGISGRRACSPAPASTAGPLTGRLDGAGSLLVGGVVFGGTGPGRSSSAPPARCGSAGGAPPRVVGTGDRSASASCAADPTPAAAR